MKAESNHFNGLLDHLPEELRRAVEAVASLDSVKAAARCDLIAGGMYIDGYLILTDNKLGYFLHADGKYDAKWHNLTDLSEVRIVEGLGVNSLRLLARGELTAEYHFTLRHAKNVAKLHRYIERQLKGREDRPEELPEAEHLEERKVRCDKCGRPIPAWSEFCPACMSRRKVLFRLLDFVKPYKARAIAGATIGVLIAVAGLANPMITRPLLDRGLGASTGKPDLPLFVLLICTLGALTVLVSIGHGVESRLMAGLGSRIARNVRDTAYEHLHKLSLSFFSRKQTGSLVTRVTSDSDRLWDFVSFTILESATSILTIGGVGVVMFILNWRLACFVLIPVPVMVFLTVFFHNKLHRFFHQLYHHWGRMTAVVADALPGVRVIKAFCQEDREVDRFSEKNRRVYDDEMAMIGTWTIFGPVMILCTQIGTIVIWLLGGFWVVRDFGRHGDGQMLMTVGTLVAFVQLMGMFYRPIHTIAHMDRQLNKAATSAQRIFEVLDTEPAIFSKTGAVEASKLTGCIELRDVSFSYDGIRKVLRNINIKIAPGEMIGLAGPSGGGKTTMVNLICRFYDAMEGQILIDGVDVRNYELRSLRRKIGVVLQEPFLFCGTIAENIAYGKPNTSLEQIMTAARAANAHDFIVGFTDGYDTLVGERGQTLSGGERQRISIARAILNNPQILILDEATSSVDTETEKLIQEALDRLVANRTTIAIAHRLSTLRKTDRLIILDKGEIVEQGTHEYLAAKKDGLYARLLNMQMEMQSVIAIAG
jgi:ATP-binding cassette subfamily B protein